jgi:ribokinase
MHTARKPIVVVGSINLDLVTNTDRIPVVGETVHGRTFQMHPGGKGANQAVAIASLGYPVQMIGKLGSDVFGDQLRMHLQQRNVGLTGVEQTNGTSGIAVIMVAPGGENCIVVTPGANAEVTPEYVDRHLDLIRGAGLVLSQLEIPIETVEHLAEVCSNEGIPFMLDPAPARDLPLGLLKRVTWFTPNETEAAFYANHAANSTSAHPELVARSLLAQGPAGVVLKMGSRGAFVAAGPVEQQLDAIAVNAVDTTAAGDALNGAFAVGLMTGMSTVESARFAVVAASLSVTRAGAQASMPMLAEVTRIFDGEQ